MTYVPHPIPTAGVVIPPDVQGFVERLARNAHDVWAARRMAEGWTWGPSRDALARKTPNLVPFDDLPQSEQDYDRDGVLETIRALLAAGFRIELTPGR